MDEHGFFIFLDLSLLCNLASILIIWYLAVSRYRYKKVLRKIEEEDLSCAVILHQIYLDRF